MVYSQTSGPSGAVLSKAPENSSIQRDSGKWTLVLFLHPRCPCSAASVEELSQLLSHCDGQIHASIILVRPLGAPQDWEQTGLAKKAATLPSATVTIDHGGAEAARFGAMTSGQCYLLRPDGAVVFQGGITAARGHAGQSMGRSAIQMIVSGKDPPISSAPVFGCKL